MVYYENDELRQNSIVYHNSDNAGEYSNISLNREDRKAKSGRLASYKEVKGFTEGNADIITSQVTNIVDYVNNPLQFTQNIDGTPVNGNWERTTRANYVSSRENYSVSNGEISYGNNGTNLIESYSDSIRYNKNGQEGLYAILKPGEERQDELKLVLNLGTQVGGTN